MPSAKFLHDMAIASIVGGVVFWILARLVAK
jgi:hypothetical protein